MADAPYTPSIDELREGYASRVLDDYERNYKEWEDLPHSRKEGADFDRGIAAHVASEVERLADELEPPFPAARFRWAPPAASYLRARAAELRKEQTDGQ